MYILGMPQVPVLGPIQDSYQVDVFYVCVNWQDVDLGRKNNTKNTVYSPLKSCITWRQKLAECGLSYCEYCIKTFKKWMSRFITRWSWLCVTVYSINATMLFKASLWNYSTLRRLNRYTMSFVAFLYIQLHSSWAGPLQLWSSKPLRCFSESNTYKS